MTYGLPNNWRPEYTELDLDHRLEQINTKIQQVLMEFADIRAFLSMKAGPSNGTIPSFEEVYKNALPCEEDQEEAYEHAAKGFQVQQALLDCSLNDKKICGCFNKVPCNCVNKKPLTDEELQAIEASKQAFLKEWRQTVKTDEKALFAMEETNDENKVFSRVIDYI